MGVELTTIHRKTNLVQKVLTNEARLPEDRRPKHRNKGHVIRIATWNVRSLLKIGALNNVKEIMNEIKTGRLR